MKLKAENNVLSATASILGLMRVNQTPEQVAKSPVVYSDKMDKKTPWVIKVGGVRLINLRLNSAF
ncbi:hypothetical protein [Yersinia mollaretii]|uniref:hypothetical protein n=1 Tax=Yersinia mollaretii TaxID=33060 RepID=UPI0002D8AC71|nr:hypothetical protein [Yersinia mollaretii]QKJ01524.1 hypothetical protein HRD69_15760 [Yersinia mollaretii ATCC 43969]